jgi:hypothetical protein
MLRETCTQRFKICQTDGKSPDVYFSVVYEMPARVKRQKEVPGIKAIPAASGSLFYLSSPARVNQLQAANI